MASSPQNPTRFALIRLWVGLLLVLLVALFPALAHAEVKRYALLIGANHGASHETPLRYAESDVNAVATVLLDLGGFANERVVRVTAASADRVRTALVDLNLTIQNDLRAGGEAVLFVYYSGHADAQSLHLGNTTLNTEELSKLIRLSQAKLKVFLLDACRSGALTRVKGGHVVAPFQIGVEDLLRNEGYAIITSSSAGEDAQESEALRSSIFTHHFLSGLRGLADISRDSLVTLGEAYTYAAEQTLKTSLNTVVGSQHATFDYDLRGRADPVISDLRTRGDRAELLLTASGEYLIMERDTGTLLFEAGVKTPRTLLQLAAGRYTVRVRTRSNVYETDLALERGESRALGPEHMKPVPLAQVVRKGEIQVGVASGPTVGGTVHGPLAAGFSPMLGMQVGWAFELPRLSLVPRLGFSQGHALNLGGTIRSHTFQEVTAEIAALYVFDLGRLAVAPMISAGWAFFKQSLESDASCIGPSCSYVARPQGLLTTVGGWAAWPLGYGFSVEASLELANFYMRQQRSTTAVEANAARNGTLTYRGAIGFGYRY